MQRSQGSSPSHLSLRRLHSVLGQKLVGVLITDIPSIGAYIYQALFTYRLRFDLVDLCFASSVGLLEAEQSR